VLKLTPPGYAPDFRNELEKLHLRVAILCITFCIPACCSHRVIPSILENVGCVSMSMLQSDIGPYLEEYFSLAGSETTFSDDDKIILTTEQYGFNLNDNIEMGKWTLE